MTRSVSLMCTYLIMAQAKERKMFLVDWLIDGVGGWTM